MLTLMDNRFLFTVPMAVRRQQFKRRISTSFAAIVVAATIVAGSLSMSDIEQFVLDQWNEVVEAAGFSRPAVEIDVASATFLTSITEWAQSRAKNVPGDTIEKYVTIAFAEASNAKVDPLLVVSVMAVESRFDYMATSSTGAKGLMQVVPSWHKEKIAVAEVYDPVANIKAGTKIIREYLNAHGGNTHAALLNYNGSLGIPGANYDARVLRTRDELRVYVERKFAENFNKRYVLR